MTQEKLKALLTLLVPQIIAEIVKAENVPEITAIERLYDSRLYAELEIEDTKLWHLSPLCLYHMFREERETGNITYPEVI